MNHGYAIYDLPIGRVVIEQEDDYITAIRIRNDREQPERQSQPAGQEAEATSGPTPLTDTVYMQLSEYCNGVRWEFDFPYKLKGTEFQQKVWQALCDIPYGETRSYREIAEAVGNPKACRAVGMANHRNPILIAVPCHRVIGSDGSLTGYGAGLPLKEQLLRMEADVLLQGETDTKQ